MNTISRISLGALAVAGLILATHPCVGEVLVSYEFTSNTLAPDVAHPSLITASNISAGSGLTLFESTTTNSRGFPDTLFGGGNDGVLQVRSGGSPNINAAITGNQYMELSINVAEGSLLHFSNITFNAASTGASQPRIFSLYADSGSGFSYLGESGGLTASSVTSTNIDLSTLSAITAPVVFRFYVVDGTLPPSTRTLGIDDIIFYGSVTAIPEPSSFALVCLGLMSLNFYTRKKSLKLKE